MQCCHFWKAFFSKGVRKLLFGASLEVYGYWGGEIVWEYSGRPLPDAKTGGELVLDFIDYCGGPLLGDHYTDQEQKTFDACCKKFHLYLIHQPFTAPGPKRETRRLT